MPYADEQAAQLLHTLQGRWKGIYQEVDGQMVEPAITAATMVELQGTEFKVRKHGEVAYEGVFSIDPLASPMEITLNYRTSINPRFLGGPRPGVFQVEADTLKWSFGHVGDPAPKELTTHPGSASVLSIYQRESPTVTAPTVGTHALPPPPLPW